MTNYLETVHRATIADVTQAAQFFQQRAGVAADRHDVSAASDDPRLAAFRLFLSHVVLEHGELWLAEDEAGITAAALWLPRNPEQFGPELTRVLLRELGPLPEDVPSSPSISGENTADELASVTPQLLKVAASSRAQLILTDVLLADDIAPGSPEGADIVRSLLRPVLSSPQYSRFAAISVDPDVIVLLQEFGVLSLASVPCGENSMAWMGMADLSRHLV